MSVYVIALIGIAVCHQIAIFKNKIDINVNINSEIINGIGIIKTSNQIHPHNKLFNKYRQDKMKWNRKIDRIELKDEVK